MSDELRLQKAVEHIRETFFPKWDSKRQWTIIKDKNLPSNGLCDPKSKRISLKYVSTDEDGLYLLLIHEIGHVATSANHGKRWKSRIIKAGDRAKEIGRNNLSDMLYNLVESYRPEATLTITAEFVYSTLEDFILDNSVLMSYGETIEKVSKHLGMYPNDLENNYKRCKTVYEKAIKFRKLCKGGCEPCRNQLRR